MGATVTNISDKGPLFPLPLPLPLPLAVAFAPVQRVLRPVLSRPGAVPRSVSLYIDLPRTDIPPISYFQAPQARVPHPPSPRTRRYQFEDPGTPATDESFNATFIASEKSSVPLLKTVNAHPRISICDSSMDLGLEINGVLTSSSPHVWHHVERSGVQPTDMKVLELLTGMRRYFRAWLPQKRARVPR